MVIHNDQEYMEAMKKFLKLVVMDERTVHQEWMLRLQSIAIGEYDAELRQ